MAVLLTLTHDTQGWDAILNANFELLQEVLVGMLDDATVPTGSIAVISLTDSTTGTPGATLVDVTASHDQVKLNDNFASINAKVDEILSALRKTGGVGVLSD